MNEFQVKRKEMNQAISLEKMITRLRRLEDLVYDLNLTEKEKYAFLHELQEEKARLRKKLKEIIIDFEA